MKLNISVRMMDQKHNAVGDDIVFENMCFIPDVGETMNIEIDWVKECAGAHWVKDELIPVEVVRREYEISDGEAWVMLYCRGSKRYGYHTVFEKTI